MNKRTALASVTTGTALLATLALAGCAGPDQHAQAAPAATSSATPSIATAPVGGPVQDQRQAEGATVGDSDTPDAFWGQIAPFSVTALRSASDAVKGPAPSGKAWLTLHSNVIVSGPLYRTTPPGRSRQEYTYKGTITAKSMTVTAPGAAPIEGTTTTGAGQGVDQRDSATLDTSFLVPADFDDFTVNMVIKDDVKANDAGRNGFVGPSTGSVEFTVPAVEMNFHSAK